MMVLAHLSDLHFGRTDDAVVSALLADLRQQHPDLIIISGDLTQRARSYQFAEAGAFLDQLPAPVLVVPGNHDLAPLYRPFSRLFRPRARFHKLVPGQTDRPIWNDQNLVAVGMDSTRAFRLNSGKLRPRDLDRVDRALKDAPATACKVVFLHHPPTYAAGDQPFQVLAERGIDLVLTGHAHHAHLEIINGAHQGSCVLVQATTACSTRLRSDSNGYGIIRVAMPELTVDLRGWSGKAFHPVRRQRFHKSGDRWRICAA